MQYDFIFYALVGGLILVLMVILLKNRPQQLPENAVSRELYQTIVTQNEMLRLELEEKEKNLREMGAQVAAREQSIIHLEDTILRQKGESDTMQKRLVLEFEQVANKILEEKGRSISSSQMQQLDAVLLPLKEKIRDFELNVDRKFTEETKEKISLKKEIEQLRDLNVQLSQDAHNLTSALKGQSKVQGDWGEFQLELLLEKSGLVKGIHFEAQSSFRDEHGAVKRPDFLIVLPDNKHLVIDAKVSLTAFERWYNEPDQLVRDKHLKAHVDSLRSHVDNLSRKNYQTLYQINTPDYLMLFVPLDSALITAAQADPKLFTDALEKNIVLVTSSTLLATMRTVAYLWKQEKQASSVQEIVRQSGYLYDKFVSFVDDLKNIGSKLNAAQSAYDDAMIKITNASRPGDTLIGKAEKLKELGAKASKSLPKEQ